MVGDPLVAHPGEHDYDILALLKSYYSYTILGEIDDTVISEEFSRATFK
ncbi:hypothetical protein ACFR99_12805 [Haloarchaeobius amylolyticus]|uniref:Uncharacterized protein n=1 Tax=Haloarchaeobius amylolyticus TaxID=1198296 RepID=A0ABD6BHC2_9EURY